MRKNAFAAGASAPDSVGGAYSVTPDRLTGFGVKGVGKGKEREGREGMGEGLVRFGRRLLPGVAGAGRPCCSCCVSFDGVELTCVCSLT